MRELKELALFLEQSDLYPMNKNLHAFSADSMFGKFYQGLVDGDFDSDESAQKILYPENPKSGSYRKLKSLLKNRLKNSVLLFDEKKSTKTPYQRAYYQSYKEWAMVKILLGQNAREAAVDVAEDILNKAIKFEFSDLAMEVSSVLRLHYGARLGNKERFDHYNAIFKKYQKIYWQEEQAQELYIDLIVNYVNNRSSNQEKQRIANQALVILDAEEISLKTRQYLLCYYLIKVMAQTSVYNYKAALDICEEAIAIFKSKGFDVNLPLQIFYYQKLLCCIQLGTYEAGKEVAETCLGLIEKGSFNWFKCYELYVILALYNDNYQQALDIYETVIRHPRFEFLPANIIEIWKIYQAYLHFLFLIKKVLHTPSSIGGATEFNLSTLLAEIEYFSKDKSGMNAAIIVIQILILLVEGDYGLADSRIDAARKYRYRHLNDEFTQRTSIFFRILGKIPLGEFKHDKVNAKAAKLQKEFANIPIELASQEVEVEIIPYEKLWQLVLSTLK